MLTTGWYCSEYWDTVMKRQTQHPGEVFTEEYTVVDVTSVNKEKAWGAMRKHVLRVPVVAMNTSHPPTTENVIDQEAHC